MPNINLENPAFISVDGAGRPNSGGTVEVYVADGLFTTLATIYSDQVKTSQLTNPVTLDDAGVKEIWYDVKVDIREKTKAGAVIRDTLNLDPNAGDAVVQGFNLAENGSFEIDADSDGQPDSWAIGPYVGSSIAITESIVTDGVKALEFNTTGAGAGGGTATSAKFPVTEGSTVSVAFSFYATNATTLNTFSINWYDHLDVLQSTSVVTMPASGSVPTSWTNYQEEITVDADGTQGEIVLTGISSGGANLSSKAYFDGISVIQLNELVTENGTQTLANKTLESPIINTGVSGTAGVSRMVRDTAATPTGVSSQDFTGIPSWVKKVTVQFYEISGSVATTIELQLGDVGGIDTTADYDYCYSELTNAAAVNVVGGTLAQFRLAVVTDASATMTGIFSMENITGNLWVCTSTISNTFANKINNMSGKKTLTGTLTQLRVKLASGTFDAGTLNIIYEG